MYRCNSLKTVFLTVQFGLCLDVFAAHFQLNSLLLLPTEASENHSQSCVCSSFHLHCTCLCALQDRLL